MRHSGSLDIMPLIILLLDTVVFRYHARLARGVALFLYFEFPYHVMR